MAAQKQATKKKQRGENSRAEAREESVITLHPGSALLTEKGAAAAASAWRLKFPSHTTIQFPLLNQMVVRSYFSVYRYTDLHHFERETMRHLEESNLFLF